MKIALFGGTGFVGSYLLDELLEQGHSARLLVRPGSDADVQSRDGCEIVAGTIADPAAVKSTIEGSDAVIYNIGILKEFPGRGVTFEALQFKGARLAIDSAKALGAQRFGLMSANGVKEDGTPYQQTKYMAEQYLQSSGLTWTIYRPSVLFGDPRGRMEFATQLYRDIVSMPIPAPLFHDGLWPFGAGSMPMSPIHVRDVASIVISSLARIQSERQIYHLGGPRQVTWKEILKTIGQATGKRVFGMPTPAWAVKTVAEMVKRLDIMPVTRDQITMLMEGNTCDSTELFREFAIDPIPFDVAHLDYLRKPSAVGAGEEGESR